MIEANHPEIEADGAPPCINHSTTGMNYRATDMDRLATDLNRPTTDIHRQAIDANQLRRFDNSGAFPPFSSGMNF